MLHVLVSIDWAAIVRWSRLAEEIVLVARSIELTIVPRYLYVHAISIHSGSRTHYSIFSRQSISVLVILRVSWSVEILLHLIKVFLCCIIILLLTSEFDILAWASSSWTSASLSWSLTLSFNTLNQFTCLRIDLTKGIDQVVHASRLYSLHGYGHLILRSIWHFETVIEGWIELNIRSHNECFLVRCSHISGISFSSFQHCFFLRLIARSFDNCVIPESSLHNSHIVILICLNYGCMVMLSIESTIISNFSFSYGRGYCIIILLIIINNGL